MSPAPWCVACSLPDSFYAIDGLIDTFITILNQMEVYPAVIDQENQRYGPFPRDDDRPDGSGQGGCGPRRGARGDQGARGRGGARSALRRDHHNDLVERLAADGRLGLPLRSSG